MSLFGTFGLTASSASAQQTATPNILASAQLRRGYNALDGGMRPGTADDQSRVLQQVLDEAARRGDPVFLPPGRYNLSNITLPARTRLMGVPGSTRLVYGGGGHFLSSLGGDDVQLSDMVLDGANLPLQPYAPGLLTVANTRSFHVENCLVTGSSAIGISLERSGGRIEKCEVVGAAGNAGIKSIEATRLAITDNHVHNCADGGIYVWRWASGEDGTQISGNRVERIGAKSGGTGQHGNGINIFRADGVSVTDNWMADCAFSAIRVNAGNNSRIAANTCLRSGETAIYVEFGFSGSIVSANMIDGATGGISCTNFNDGGRLATVSDNIVRNLKTRGPYVNETIDFGWGIHAEADTVVTGNLVERAPLYGLSLGWGVNLRNVLASGNIIRDAGTGIAVSVADGAGAAMILDNMIDGTARGAILGHRWKQAVTEDLVGRRQNHNGGFEQLTINGNRSTGRSLS
ncbi:MAG: TIGR03808 family TAT-translocated repetitive protein [Pseudomonadota bacterium]